jgi:hypothetical protein
MRSSKESSTCLLRRPFGRGQGLVELAMALPLLLLMLVAAVDMGRLLFMSIAANSAARAGVQYGAQSVITASDANGMVQAALQDGKDVSGLSATASYYCKCPDGSTPNSCGDNVCASGQQIIYVNVVTTAQFTAMTRIPGIPSPLTVSASATRRVGMQ